MDAPVRALESTRRALKAPSGLRAFFAVVVFLWASAALLLWLFSPSFTGGIFVAVVAYWAAAIFAGGALAYAALASRGAERFFWALLAGGLILRLAAQALRGGLPRFDLLPPVLALNDVVYGLSYGFLFLALLWMVTRTLRYVTPLAVLDTVSVAISSGLLIWYFALGPASAEAGLEGPVEVLMVLAGPVCNVGLLYLALVIFSADRKPPFASLLLATAVAFVVAEAIGLGVRPFEPRPFGPFEFSGWVELFWALGVILLGLTALRGASQSFIQQQREISPRRVYAFWLGPLSPILHYGLLLVWGALNQPLPQYVLFGGAVLLVCLALRLSVVSGYSRKLRLDVERLVEKRERNTISEELHDTLKQSVYSTALLLGTYRKVREKKGPEAAEEVLDRAIDASREANHRISQPIEELRVLSSEPGSDIIALLRRLSDEVRRYFGVEVHEELQADLDVLNTEELAAAYRIVGEALWNAAKHSGAQNAWIESGREDSFVWVGVRDDGSGLNTEDEEGGGESSAGLGLSLMRDRAEKTGGSLEVTSSPGEGTTVKVWYRKG